MANIYEVRNAENVISPSLIYYEEIIRENIEKAIRIAGSAERLWPHVKSHKSIDMVKTQIGYGITKFKTATIAEAEMVADAGAERIILAYPLIGPNMERFINLNKAYPQVTFYALEDDLGQFERLSALCQEQDITLHMLIDVNMGMNRTGIDIDRLEALYRAAAILPGIDLCGLHCYDGNHNNKDFQIRLAEVDETDKKVMEVVRHLAADGIKCETIVAGGTPSFPCHAQCSSWYLSPGTAFITDAGYYMNLPDLPFIPGAAVLTRVISHPAPGVFTTDLGYKGIAADPAGQRGYIVGLEDAEPIIHSEEHWAFRLRDESKVPAIDTCLYVIPTHICPTSAMYPDILVARDGAVVDRWPVTARNRKITY